MFQAEGAPGVEKDLAHSGVERKPAMPPCVETLVEVKSESMQRTDWQGFAYHGGRLNSLVFRSYAYT